MTGRVSAMCVWLVTLLGVGLSLAVTMASARESDIARAEKEFELRQMARGMFGQAQERAENAVSESSAGEQLRERVSAAFAECLAEADALMEAGILDEARRVLDSCPVLLAELSSGNADLIAKLRDDFLAEEIEELRGTMDDEQLALLESAIRDIVLP